MLINRRLAASRLVVVLLLAYVVVTGSPLLPRTLPEHEFAHELISLLLVVIGASGRARRQPHAVSARRHRAIAVRGPALRRDVVEPDAAPPAARPEDPGPGRGPSRSQARRPAGGGGPRPPANPLGWLLFWPWLAAPTVAENLRRRVPAYLRAAGFTPVEACGHWLGVLTLWAARKPGNE